MKFSNINSFNNYFLHILNYSNRFNNSFCLWDKQWNINQSVPQRMLSFAFFILDTFWYRQQPVENKLQQQGNSYDDFTFLSPYSTRFGWRFPFLFIYVTLSLFLYCEVSRGRCCCHFWGIWVASVMFVSFSITPSIHLFLGSSSWSVFFFFFAWRPLLLAVNASFSLKWANNLTLCFCTYCGHDIVPTTHLMSSFLCRSSQ